MTQERTGRVGPPSREDSTDVLPTVTSGSASAAGRSGPARHVDGRGGRVEARPAGRPARRRARLALTRVDPLSVFLLALLVSLFLGVVLLAAVAGLFALLDNLGVLQSLDRFAVELDLIPAGQSLLTGTRVLGATAVVAAVDVVVLTVLATLGAFLYNLCASLTGGIEVTLSERE